jgi:NAD(P)-dependent dehydrogenase (short-subunit alcohol dehydrogenase family)
LCIDQHCYRPVDFKPIFFIGGGRTRDNKAINSYVASITALGRVGLPDDIGGVVAFLGTEEARWINGQRIELSCGMSL